MNFDRLRYRMLPYIYSLAWKTTSEAYTPMRPLVMDFRTDSRAQNIGDQFMFGPAFLVNPVTDPAATSAATLSARGEVVRLLDGIGDRRWADDQRHRTSGPSAVVRARRIDSSSGTGRRVVHARKLPTRSSFAFTVVPMAISHSTKTRTTTTTTKRARTRRFPCTGTTRRTP